MEAILKIKGLKSYYYSGQNVIPAVDGVDLDIYPGEIVGIVGESGCGKSTVVRSLMGLLDPVSSKREGGQAIYLGKDLFQMKEKELFNNNKKNEPPRSIYFISVNLRQR